MNRNLPVLIVDDSEDDVFILTRVLRSLKVTGQFSVVNSAERAIDYLEGQGEFADRTKHPFPSVILLDIRMSGGDGFMALEWLRKNTQFSIIPIVVLSGSNAPEVVVKAYRLGANCFLQKPASPDELRNILKLTIEFWAICEKPAYSATIA